MFDCKRWITTSVLLKSGCQQRKHASFENVSLPLMFLEAVQAITRWWTRAQRVWLCFLVSMINLITKFVEKRQKGTPKMSRPCLFGWMTLLSLVIYWNTFLLFILAVNWIEKLISPMFCEFSVATSKLNWVPRARFFKSRLNASFNSVPCLHHSLAGVIHAQPVSPSGCVLDLR